MSNFLQKYSNASSEEEKDKLLKKAVGKILDEQLRDRWSQQLAQEYGVKREVAPPAIVSRRIWTRVVAIAAGIAILIALLPLFHAEHSLEEQILNLVQEQPISHPGVEKGITTDEDVQMRAKAIRSYNTRQYSDAARHFGMISDQKAEDVFYQATAYLYAESYNAAIKRYRDLQMEGSDQFRQETNWYLSLALILDGQKEEAKKILQTIHCDEWHYEDAREVLNNLP